MARFIKSSEKATGLSPWSPVFIGNRKLEKTIIRILDYNKNTLEDETVDTPGNMGQFFGAETVTWISVYGLHDVDIIKSVGEIFGIHPLTLGDIANTGQRPKMEEYENYIYLVLKMLRFDSDEEIVKADQLSLILGEHFLLTFHEQPIDIFLPVRQRISKSKGRIREKGPDYLAYALLDTIIDNYMIAIENIGSKIEELEDLILEEPTQELLSQITNYKREVNYLRKSIRPARELLLQLAKNDSEFIREQTTPFLKDLQDIATQATETLDSYREMLSDHLNIYNTAVSNRLNEIMKVLTVFAAIFIPLTFIAGIYGTNFEYVPELHFKYSYFIFWGMMLLVAGVMLRFFRRKGWL
ncbi:magnesium/cobalt transporter CorA [Desulfogranum marinum]|uniref:magnesium/cobalt transporter CorA n=1 Tax=Desulfogranum marinum TaxID=453220 RepID=UPI0029C65CDB|nr:magnesium/cobalt transporter CorA [Desulfogranum marinum]